MFKRIIGCVMLAAACIAADKVYIDGVSMSGGLSPEQLEGLKDRAGSWIIVDKGGDGDFTTFRDAITHAETIHATNGGARVDIFIGAGAYYEGSLRLNGMFNILGTGRSNIVGDLTIDGGKNVALRGVNLFTEGTVTNVLRVVGEGTGIEMRYCAISQGNSVNATAIGILFEGNTSTSDLDYVSIYTANRNTGADAKTIGVASLGSSKLNHVVMRHCVIKLSSGAAGAKNEYPVYLTGRTSVELHGCTVNWLHDPLPRVHLSDFGRLLWKDTSTDHDPSALAFSSPNWELQVEGTNPSGLYMYDKQVGRFKANNDAVFEGTTFFRGPLAYHSPYTVPTSVINAGAGNVSITPDDGSLIKLDVLGSIALEVSGAFDANNVSSFIVAIRTNDNEVDLLDHNVKYHDNVNLLQGGWIMLYYTKAFDNDWTAIQLNTE